MTLLIDNYDSFSYNLYQMIGEINADIKVIRNDEMTLEEIRKQEPDRIIISPGPGRPENAGICETVIREIGPDIPILGVCLGHQAICEVFGATIGYAKKLMHGKMSMVNVTHENPLFQGLGDRFSVARYHSLAAEENTIPDELLVTAITDDGEIMAVTHKKYPIYGLQFHPESILTPDGKVMLENFMKMKA